MILEDACIPTTFAHLGVYSRGFLETEVTHIACGIDIALTGADVALTPDDFALQVLRPAERALLDAIGLKLFSSFVGISFDVGGDALHINAWQLQTLSVATLVGDRIAA